MTDTKSGTPTLLFVSFRQLQDPIEEKRRFRMNFAIEQKKPQLRNELFSIQA